MIKVYIFTLVFSLELFAANIDNSSLKEIYENLSKTMPQPIGDIVSTLSLGLIGLPILLLILSPMIVVLYAMYKTVVKFIRNNRNP